MGMLRNPQASQVCLLGLDAALHCSTLFFSVFFFWIIMFCFSKLIIIYEFKTVEEFLYLFPGEYQCIWFFGLLAFSSFWMVDLSSLHV